MKSNLLLFLLCTFKFGIAQPTFLFPDNQISTINGLQMAENSIAVNLYNPKLIFNLNNAIFTGGTPNSGVAPFFSMDGGYTWEAKSTSTAQFGTNPILPSHLNSQADPAVVMDRANTVYLAYLTYNPQQVAFLRTSGGFPNYEYYDDFTLASSANTFQIIPGTTNADKTAIQISNSPIAETNELYLGFRGNAPPGDAMVSYSYDAGNTWQTDNLCDPSTGFNAPASTQQNFGISLASGPKGKEYAAWAIIVGQQVSGIGFSSILSRAFYPNASWQSKSIPGISPQTTYHGISIAVNQQSEAIYIVWAGNLASPNNLPEENVLFIKSLDGGVTWSPPSPILTQGIGTSISFKMAKIAIDPFTGLMGVLFYCKNNNLPYLSNTSVQLAISEDFGATWNVQSINDNAFNVSVGSVVNDYLDLKIVNNWVVPVWSDNQTVFSQPFEYPIEQNIILPDAKNPETLFYEIHKAMNQVETDPNLGYEAGEHINVYAGQKIHLRSHFHVAAGNKFHAHIQPIPSPFNSGERKRNAQEAEEADIPLRKPAKYFAFPNPSSEKIKIGLTTETNTLVDIELFDQLGRSVKRLVESRSVERGTYYYELDFNAEGLAGSLFYCNIRTTEDSQILKIIHLKQ